MAIEFIAALHIGWVRLPLLTRSDWTKDFFFSWLVHVLYTVVAHLKPIRLKISYGLLLISAIFVCIVQDRVSAKRWRGHTVKVHGPPFPS